MQIQNLRRMPGAGTLVALFDLEATPEITINDWQLRRTQKGLRAFPPSPRSGRPCVFLKPALYTEIGRAAAAMYEGGNARHDRTAA